MLALLDDWAGHDRVICVDAAAPAGEPGRIVCFDPLQGALPKGLPATSSHALGLAEVIDLARVLGALPRRLVVFAIEGACFDIGAGMTPAVAAAAGQVADRIVAGLNARSAAPV